MPKCKWCKSTYHNCSSCNYDPYAAEGYCCSGCYELSDGFKKKRDKIIHFIESLNLAQLKDFSFLLNDNIILNYYIDRWLKIVNK